MLLKKCNECLTYLAYLAIFYATFCWLDNELSEKIVEKTLQMYVFIKLYGGFWET